VIAASPIIDSAPIGPSTRRFANAVAMIETDESPPALLARLKRIERASGRRPGRRWGARVIDLDIILWSGGIWADRTLVIPHPAFRQRGFVVASLVRIAPDWIDPVTGRTIRQLAHRLRHG
jgi:2-amino-4-hydroxy-6-hydroxymethyldihydropteridine diphosphokinase